MSKAAPFKSISCAKCLVTAFVQSLSLERGRMNLEFITWFPTFSLETNKHFEPSKSPPILKFEFGKSIIAQLCLNCLVSKDRLCLTASIEIESVM